MEPTATIKRYEISEEAFVKLIGKKGKLKYVNNAMGHVVIEVEDVK